MNEFIKTKLGVGALSVLSLLIVGILLVNWRAHARAYRVTIAAGSPTGESYLLSTALAAVIRRHYPNIELMVRETGGTAESLTLLDQGAVGMAAAQADVALGEAARIVAVLYDDTFQLIFADPGSVHRPPLAIRWVWRCPGRASA